jgi:hypothetical protein
MLIKISIIKQQLVTGEKINLVECEKFAVLWYANIRSIRIADRRVYRN